MRAVKFILFLLLSLFTVQWGIAWLADMMYRGNFYGQSGGQINYYLTTKPPEILIMGSSRARHNLDPDSLPGSGFNLSHNGMRIGYQAALLDILDQNDQLPSKYLILQIEPENFTNRSNLRKDIQFLSYYYGENEYVTEEIRKLSWTEGLKYLFSLYRHNGNILSLANNYRKSVEQGRPSTNGFQGVPPQKEDSSRVVISTKNRKENYEKMKEKNRDNAPLTVMRVKRSLGFAYLEHIRSLCYQKNIKLILFTAPCYEMPPDWKENQVVEQCLSRYEFTYWNFSTSTLPQLENIRLWRDFRHLNQDGARVFTRIFSEKFKQQEALNK